MLSGNVKIPASRIIKAAKEDDDEKAKATDKQQSEIRGRMALRRKKKVGAPVGSQNASKNKLGQNDPSAPTAKSTHERIANETGVSQMLKRANKNFRRQAVMIPMPDHAIFFCDLRDIQAPPPGLTSGQFVGLLCGPLWTWEAARRPIGRPGIVTR